jgi:Tubulin like
MLRPFLLVGVGGSGGKTLRVVRQDLERRLAQVSWEGDLPQAWQFLQIDVPTHADGNEPDLPAHLPTSQYQGLVADGLTYRTIDSALAGSGRTKMSETVAGWRPDPAKVNVPVSKGAGQYRAIGRMITVARMDRVRSGLEARRRALSGAEVMGELQAATRALGGTPRAIAEDPVVVVVSSIAGGSGAGAVIDVCDAIRSLGEPWAGESIGFLYAPDVFDYIPQEQRRGVRPNALACLSELLSGYWNSDGPSEQTAALLAKHGVQIGAANRLGPRYPFLVGNRNEHVAFGTQNDIYRAMGRSIAAWVTSNALQGMMGSYIQGNWSNASQAVPDSLPLKLAGTETPFSALGSARVGLGRDRFRDYAAQALARQAVDRTLLRHEEQRGPTDDRTNKKLIADVAEMRFGAFLTRSELDERGEKNNDLLDALRPPSQKDDARALSAEITNKITSEINEKSGQALSVVRQRILSELHAREAKFGDEQRNLRLQQGRDWIGHIQEHLVRLVATTIATDGAPVTAEMLSQLGTELRQVRTELETEAKSYRRWAGDMQSFSSELGAAETLMKNNPVIENAVKRAVQTLLWAGEADLRDLVVEIIPDLVENVVEPLATAVRAAATTLAQEKAPSNDGRASTVTEWPEDNLVPERLRPAANEFLVDPVSTYPAELGTLIERTVGADRPGGARPTAIMQVMLGGAEVDQGPQELVSLATGWVPREYTLHASGGDAPTRARFEVKLGAADLLSRADAWVTQKGTVIGAYTSQTLKEFLNPNKTDPEQHAARLGRFEGQFIAAINAAAPLVSINPRVLSEVHGVADAPSKTYFTEIPFPDKSPARETVKRILQGRELWNAEVEQSLGDGDAAAIDVFSVLGMPLQPVVFDSIMKPIASEWGARAEADQRTEFWRWRRARPLTEFLPMSPEIRKAMVRGWFTARALGQLQLENDKAAIFAPTEAGAPGTFVDFPSPFLSAETPHNHDYLPVVLISILLALVEVNTKESLNPMKPYARLRDLGRDGRDGGYAQYIWAGRELEAWIVDAKTAAGAPQVPAASAPDGEEWELRRDALESRFASFETAYTELFKEVDARTDVFDVTIAYELRRDILEALGDLQRAVRHVTPKSIEGEF